MRHPLAVLLAVLLLGIPVGISAQATEDATATALRYQLNAAIAGGAVLAKNRGVAVEQHCGELGALYAPTWGGNVTASRLATGMANNLEMMGYEGELISDDGNVAAIRWTPLDTETYRDQYGNLGLSYEDFDTCLSALGSALAREHGLHWAEEADGNRRVVRISTPN